MGHTALRPGQPLGMRQQGAMFKAFLDAIGVGQVDLVGNDSGGGAAQVFAARNPGYVRTLALTNCEVHAYQDSPASEKFRQGVESGALARALQAALDNPDVLRKAFAVAYEKPGELSDEAIRAYVAPLVASPERLQQLRDYVAATTNRDLIEIEPLLRALPAPTLVMWGTDDGFFPVMWAHWLRDHLPNVVEVIELAGARVFWPEERPQFLNRKLRELWTGAG